MKYPKGIVGSITIVRFLLGWYMFFDGLKILLTPHWSAAGFLSSAKTFPVFYAWFAQPSNLWWVNPVNSWGIVLIGVALLCGVGVRAASWAGAILMILYYFPHYVFPVVPYGYIVEEHIIYATMFVFIALFPPAWSIGLSSYLRRTSLNRIPLIRSLL